MQTSPKYCLRYSLTTEDCLTWSPWRIAICQTLEELELFRRKLRCYGQVLIAEYPCGTDV